MKQHMTFARRGLLSAAALGLAAFALGTPSLAQAPKSPQVINVVDVGGALAVLAGRAVEAADAVGDRGAG